MTSDARKLVDLRSDALCSPTADMWEAMRRAEVGWALYGEDRNVTELEALGAALLGKEGALFVSTCSMANFLALMTLGSPGTRIVAGRTMHVATTEALNLAHPLGLMLEPLDDAYGVLEPDAVLDAMTRLGKQSHPQVSVVCLENSHNNAGGVAVTPRQTEAVADVARRFGATVHLDGARLFNVAAALGVASRQLAAAVDTVALSLNKGLGAPWGALLCGPRTVVEAARVNAKRIGAASVHKAGIFAAAGIVALTDMPARLAEDNRRAAELAHGIDSIPGLRVPEPQTNLVLVDTAPTSLAAPVIVERLSRHRILSLTRSPTSIRFVTYRQIRERDVRQATGALAAILQDANDCGTTASTGHYR